jgi:3-dehydroquinate dehydratase
MVRLVEKDGAYLVEMKVETLEEKEIMTKLLELDRKYKANVKPIVTAENCLDSSYDMAKQIDDFEKMPDMPDTEADFSDIDLSDMTM